jgi:hypothetical protein
MVSNKKAMPGAGDVELSVSGEKVVLRPSLNAAIKLSTQPGGLSKMVERCTDLDFDAICDVLIIGGGMTVGQETKEDIFKEGIINLVLPCVRFLNLLATGGKPADESEESDPLARSSR